MRPITLKFEKQLLSALQNAAESKHSYIEYLHISKPGILYYNSMISTVQKQVLGLYYFNSERWFPALLFNDFVLAWGRSHYC